MDRAGHMKTEHKRSCESKIYVQISSCWADQTAQMHKLLLAFIFTYNKIRFSHNETHFDVCKSTVTVFSVVFFSQSLL